MKCQTCGAEMVLEHKAGRQEFCPKYSTFLHACLNKAIVLDFENIFTYHLLISIKTYPTIKFTA